MVSSESITFSVSGRREQGTQPKKWMDNVIEDMETRKMRFQQALTSVQDRIEWRHLIATKDVKGLSIN